jgi:hypothetical protein
MKIHEFLLVKKNMADSRKERGFGSGIDPLKLVNWIISFHLAFHLSPISLSLLISLSFSSS